MALSASEVARIKAELGYNVLAVGAEPYVSIVALFESVIAPYTLTGAATTSATAVAATSTPTPTTITLADATGFTPGAVAVVDVDARQERATVTAVAGATITLQLSQAHAGTYPVVVESGEGIIRDILSELHAVATEIGSLRSRVGIKSVDGEIEFFGGGRTTASQGIDPLTAGVPPPRALEGRARGDARSPPPEHGERFADRHLLKASNETICHSRFPRQRRGHETL